MARRHVGTIVVGAGAAGCVIANRVTERADRDVLLLEAGPDYPLSLPSDLSDGTKNSLFAHDWGYEHRPTTKQLRFPLPRGKVVGGSSAVNTCIALRGVPSDYDEWASLGLPEWSWEACLPAFRRLERDLDVESGALKDPDGVHNTSGPLPLRRHPDAELVPWQRAFREAARGLGFPETADHNHPNATGFGPHAMNKLDGKRVSAARAYLTSTVRQRDNLTIQALTTVRRVLFEGTRAVGVEIERREKISEIYADRIVLAGGAIATPGILLRSGIGSRQDLTRLGITPIREIRAVAAKLLDHPGSAIFFKPKRGLSSLEHPLIQMALRTRSVGSQHNNDLQLQAGSCVHAPWFSAAFVTLMCQVGKPVGHGNIVFESADPNRRPIINSQLNEDSRDRAVAIEGLQLAMELFRSSEMSKMATPVWPVPWALKTTAGLDRWVRRVTDSGYHPCGTVPMGAENDPNVATDGRGRVRGTRGLYVADASLMPTVPTSNTHLPTLMIGERFGEWLRDGD